MEYRELGKTGLRLSALGFGASSLGGVFHSLREEDGIRAVFAAIEGGINFIDVSPYYGYLKAEQVLGKALRQIPRDKYILSTKVGRYGKDGVNSWDYSAKRAHDSVFESMERLGVDYIDFYLCHNVNEGSIDTFMNLEVPQFMERMKAEGKIRYLGFSSHGQPETLRRFASLRDWDFAQIQLNYFDWFRSSTKAQYEVLRELNIPIVVMEPARGGRLADLTAGSNALLKAAEPDRSIASWAFRFVKSLPGIQVILSGMNAENQMSDNLATFSQEDKLTDADLELLQNAVDMLVKEVSAPCTACRYCSECPMELDIPELLKTYNQYAISKSGFALMGLNNLPEDKRPSACIGCGTCASACPQNIQIPDLMAEMAEAMSRFHR